MLSRQEAMKTHGSQEESKMALKNLDMLVLQSARRSQTKSQQFAKRGSEPTLSVNSPVGDSQSIPRVENAKPGGKVSHQSDP